MKIYSNNSDNYFVVNNIDFEKIKNLSWREDKDGYYISAINDNGERKYLRLHRYILEDELNGDSNKEVDHIRTLDRWDNRRNNLRITNDYGNAKNRKIHKNNTSGIPCVDYVTKSDKWRVIVQETYYGTFSDKYDAFCVSRDKHIELFGKYNSINWNKIEKKEFPGKCVNL